MKIFTDAGRGGHFTFVANMAVVVAVGFTALAMLLDQATNRPDAALAALFTPKDGRVRIAATARPPALREAIVPSVEGIDTMPTASIGRPIVLNPCLERQK